MTNQEEWNEFLDNLFSNALENYRNSPEHQHIKKREEEIDDFLSTNLTVDENKFVEEIIFELGLTHERKAQVVYQQGLKDCIWILKNLGVLA